MHYFYWWYSKLILLRKCYLQFECQSNPYFRNMLDWFFRFRLLKRSLCHWRFNEYVLWITSLFEWSKIWWNMLQRKYLYFYVRRIIRKYNIQFFNQYEYELSFHKSYRKLLNMFRWFIRNVLQLLFFCCYGRSQQCHGNLHSSRFSNRSNKKRYEHKIWIPSFIHYTFAALTNPLYHHSLMFYT